MQHLQYHRRQIGTTNLRIGEGWTAVKVILGIQAHTNPRSNPAAAALALISAGLRHRFNRQPLYFRARAITADTRLTRIYHVDDARHRQGGFCDVGGQHDTAASVGGKDLLLLGC